MRIILMTLAVVACMSTALAEEPVADGLDYGDYSSATLMIKGWEALGEGKYEDTVKLTDKCVELYEERRRRCRRH